MDYCNVLSPIIDLIIVRYEEQLYTQSPPIQIEEKYGNRIVDRFNEMVENVILKNGTYEK